MIRKIIKLTLLSVLIGIFVFIIPALHIRVVNAEEEIIDSETFKYDFDKEECEHYIIDLAIVPRIIMQIT